jgi:hypothetical protein
MSRIIVATNPANDAVTQYLDAWQTEVVNLAKNQKDTIIFELNKEKTNKKDLIELIKEKNPQLVILNGHGSYDSVFGFDGSVLIKADENNDILIRRIVHSLTCSSGKVLGSSCIKIGTLAYIGYKEEFKIAYLNNRNTKEEKFNDEIAGLFLEPAFEAIFSLIRGCSALEAFHDSQKKYLKNLNFAIAANNPGLNTAVAPRLYHNFIHQVCLGDGSACF